MVWPVSALFATLPVLWLYWRYGRLGTEKAVKAARERDEDAPNKRLTPVPVMVAKGALHCGSGGPPAM